MAQMNWLSILLFVSSVSLSHGFFKWENCVKPENTTAKVKQVHGCEDKDDVILSCNQGYKISVVKAFFGHGHGHDSTCDSSAFGQNCGATGAAIKVKYLCQDKQRCTIRPTTDVLGSTSCVFGLDSDLFVDYVCNPESVRDTIAINSLELSPSPLVLPGTVNVSASLTVKRHLPSTTKLKLDIQKKVGAWIPIPCVSNFGSCTYDNFCELLRGLMFSKCDAKMEKAGIPCDCPIPTGTFTLPIQSITVTKEHVDKIPVWNGIVEGKYWLKAEFFDVYIYDRPLGCFTVQVELDINSKKKRTLHFKWPKNQLHTRRAD